MKKMFILFSLCLILIWGTMEADVQEPKTGPEVFTGFVMVVGSPASGQTTRFTLTIDEYTSDEDTLKYATILKDQGQKAFRETLEKVTAGYIAPTGQMREPVNVARSHNVEGGRVINIVKTRYLHFLEFALGTPRSRDYDITFIQLKINEKGEGEGFMFAGTKLMFDENNKLVLEQRGTTAIRISNVKLKKK